MRIKKTAAAHTGKKRSEGALMRPIMFFWLGMMAGGTLGVILMCLLQIARDPANERKK